jgi:hypothetical protein
MLTARQQRNNTVTILRQTVGTTGTSKAKKRQQKWSVLTRSRCSERSTKSSTSQLLQPTVTVNKAALYEKLERSYSKLVTLYKMLE